MYYNTEYQDVSYLVSSRSAKDRENI